ncbi:galactokinase [Mesohalobacter salilacus]|uniref:galactokinase n=1 Tax=Mesohalobacter salilacus TaxID=2491711 RepID=UPI00269173F1
MYTNNFKSEIVIESPGRINLIGEHIDYNGGHVLPAAINKKITLKFKKNNTQNCQIYSANFKSSFQIDLKHIKRSQVEWQNFVLGVLYHIDVLKPNSLQGFDCIIESNLPLGSGISSSAALECGIAKGVSALFDLKLTDMEIITLSRDAEHTFVGTKCGIMDQFAVVKGQTDHLILLNCDTLDFKLIQAKFDPYIIVLLNTNVSHNLASSEYNIRRDECDTALEAIQKKYPEYKDLANIPVKIVNTFKSILPEKIYNRALYVAQENKRTLKAVKHLQHQDLEAFGKCMYKSHEGLQHLYEVSCKELDFLVKSTKDLDYVLGSRMMGGGFGGCTINLVHKNEVDDFVQNLSAAYEEQFDIQLTSIQTTIGDGTKTI